MADDDVLLDDDIEENDDTSFDETEAFTSVTKTLDARKRLEEYLEEKRLKELLEF